jgi:hypothetical protein
MKRIKKHQAKNCTECKRLGVKRPAHWRRDGFWSRGYCDEHKHLIKERCDSGHKSEAEYQIERMYGIEL